MIYIYIYLCMKSFICIKVLVKIFQFMSAVLFSSLYFRTSRTWLWGIAQSFPVIVSSDEIYKPVNYSIFFQTKKTRTTAILASAEFFINFKYFYFYLQTQLCQSDCWGIVRWLYKAISEHRISGSVWKMEWFTKESPALCARQRQIV